jgi:hypothetical protein
MVLLSACGLFGSDPTATPPPEGNPANNPPPAQQGQGQDTLDDSIDVPVQAPTGDGSGQDPLDDSVVPPAGGGGDAPQVQNGMVVLANTAWVLGSDVNQTYTFCGNGNWTLEGGPTPQSGTFQVQDNNLIMTSNNNATTYQMNWKQDEATLELTGGSGPIQLEFEGGAGC